MRREQTERIDAAIKRAQLDGRCLASTVKAHQRMLRTRRDAGLLVSPFPGLYDSPSHWSRLSASEQHLHVIRALSRLHPNWVFCHQSAAVAHGFLELAPGKSLCPHVCTSDRANSISSTHTIWHHARGIEGVNANGATVTSSLRTTFDCLRSMPAANGIAVADAYLRKTGDSPESLSRSICKFKGLHGRLRAQELAKLARPLSENGGESIARINMLALGFAEPELQVELPDPLNPQKFVRLDYLWLREGLDRQLVEQMILSGEAERGFLEGCIAGELDGRQKYTDPGMNGGSAIGALTRERRRESRLTHYGLHIVRFSFAEACHPQLFEHLLLSAGVPRAEVPPALLTPSSISA